MFLIRLLRLLPGCVRFRARGGFGERFINLCSINGITLWDMETHGDEIYASTTIDGYRKIRKAASGSGMTTRIVSKSGLPFFIFRNRKRTGIPAGIIIFIITTSILSTRIWLIEIEGGDKIPEERILCAVEDAGLKIGCSALSADPVNISLKASGKIEGASEIAVNIKGSKATVKIKERGEEPTVQDSSGLYNITASKDAQLVVLEPYKGTAIAKRFNTVLKGEVLISGIVANKDESTGYVHASGYAVGRTQTDVKASAAPDEKFTRPLSVKKVYTLFFFGAEIPLGRQAPKYSLAAETEKYLSFNGKRMPFGIFHTEYCGFKKTAAPDANQTELMCIERYVQKAMDYTETRQLISESSAENFDSEKKAVDGVFTCYENIGVEKEFSIDESRFP